MGLAASVTGLHVDKVTLRFRPCQRPLHAPTVAMLLARRATGSLCRGAGAGAALAAALVATDPRSRPAPTSPRVPLQPQLATPRGATFVSCSSAPSRNSTSGASGSSDVLCFGDWEFLPGGGAARELWIQVPLSCESSDKITVFAREIVSAKNVAKATANNLPTLVWLQGGPGFASPRPLSTQGGWLGRALEEYRVVVLDQRGTGRSSPVTAQTLRHLSADQQAAYLMNFRADAIVRDCEALRKTMGISKWSLLGQSFGGFCALTYLSFKPESLNAVYLTGGLAPVMETGPDEVYRSCYRQVIERNKHYYRRYPGDVQRVKEIVQHLQSLGPQGAKLPGGGNLTARRFLSLGLMLGDGSGIETMHWLVESAFIDTPKIAHGYECELDERFLAKVQAADSFDNNPIYWLLHEAIYCDGPAAGPSAWSAHRVLQEAEFRKHFAVALGETSASDADGPIYFTGEMVFPWFGEDSPTLQHLKGAAERLAEVPAWPPLYNKDVLRETKVPVAAAMYYDDMYVVRAFGEDTAKLLGPNCKVWVTNEFQHSGVRDDGRRVLDTLFKMLRGEVQIPS